MSLPSIRECEQRLQALGAAELDHPAVAIARALLHYVRNAGTPPVIAPSPKVQAQSLSLKSRPQAAPAALPAHLVRRPGSWTEANADKVARLTAAPKQHLDIKQVLARLNRSEPWVYNSINRAGFPRPSWDKSDGFGRNLWEAAAVEAWIASNPPERKPYGRAPGTSSTTTKGNA